MREQSVQDDGVGSYLAALTGRAAEILGPDLVGVYAAGSIALDAYQVGRSDIDVAIVCAKPLIMPTKRAIVAAMRHESLPCPARGLELVVYRAGIAAAGTPEPGFEVELNTGARMDFRVTWSGAERNERDGTFWYAIDRSILAERGRCLVGAPAAQVFRSVPDAGLVELLIASLRWHLAQGDTVPADEPASWTSDAVLNACRAWRRVRKGQWTDKVTAGREVEQAATAEWDGPGRGDAAVDPGVIGQALAARSGGAAPLVGQARQFQHAVLAQLQQAAAG
jgi:hypothetical protein